MVPDGLTVTVGVGSTLFDDRYGLAAGKPGKLTPMRTFPDDALDPAQCGGDLVVQLSAGHTDTVLHALRDITRHTRGAMQINWRMDGYTSPARPSGTVPRNHFGFMDGISNPSVADPATMNRLVWVDASTKDEPSWTAGGSYLVVRLIRMLTEFWDRVSIAEQEEMIGRRRPSGYPLDANSIHAAPNFALDPNGGAIPLTAHMRLANPRTPQTGESRILAPGLQLRPRPRQRGHKHFVLNIHSIKSCCKGSTRERPNKPPRRWGRNLGTYRNKKRASLPTSSQK